MDWITVSAQDGKAKTHINRNAVAVIYDAGDGSDSCKIRLTSGEYETLQESATSVAIKLGALVKSDARPSA